MKQKVKRVKKLTPAGIGVARDMDAQSFGSPIRRQAIEQKNTPQEQGEAVNNKQ